MAHTAYLRSLLALGVSSSALLAAQPVFAQEATSTVGEVVVTAQRREQALQDVPIAVSAFSGEGLKVQSIDTGQDLLFAVPNVNFSRANFGGFNFQIRGIGTKLVATGADAAIGVHVNNVPLGASTLADSNFFDVERIEILRGPQGTQFGRNTTGGLINIITAKPTDGFSASVTGELANYNSQRANGFINIPLGDKLAFRAAGSYSKRDGFGENLVTGSDIDGRDLWSSRLTLAFNPTDTFSAYLMWEHFEEDDDRTQVGKQLCIKDLGDTTVGGVSTTVPGRQTQNFFSQGCALGNLRGKAGLGTINTAATLGGGLGNISGLITGDANVGNVQDPDLRSIESAINPTYLNNFDAYIFNAVWDLTDTMSLSYTASYSEGDSYQRADYNRVTPSTTFNPNVPAFFAGMLTDANGFFDDPQVGRSNQFRTFQVGTGVGESQTHEVRLQSSFDGPFNFSAGASYQEGDTTTNLYVLGNTLTAAARYLNGATPFLPGAYPPGSICPLNGGPSYCIFVDLGADPDGSGGNYFNSRTRYQIESRALFGEVNYEITDTFRVTAGLRFTQDAKKVQPYQPATLVRNNVGVVPQPIQKVTFEEMTGRLNFDWTPTLSFTDRTLIYASIARGYKGGGFNPPESAGQTRFPDTYEPEFINALEIGAKNTLMGGKMVLNLTGFYYDYKGYQVSQIIERTSVNSNIDATVWGLELESIWEPVPNLRLNANIGYLNTELADTLIVDVMDLTQGDPTYVTLKNGSTFANCIALTSEVAALQAQINAGAPGLTPAAIGTICAGGFATGTPAAAFYGAVNPLNGVPDQLGGNELPNSPEFTVSLGAQYRFEFAGAWSATPRIDFYYQASSYSRIYNRINDVLDSYTNTNVSLTFENPDWGVTAQVYVRNVSDEEAITDQYLTDESSGLYTNIFLGEPRTYGVSVTKSF